MPPIKLHTESPISTTAAKASGISPITATSDYPPTPTRTHITTITSLKTDNSPAPSYPAARPGQTAFPGPTATPPRYAPPPPTTTTPLAAYNSPPPPQPNAFPRPLSPYSAPPRTLSPSLPPPPRAGDTPRRPSASPSRSPMAGRLYPVVPPPAFGIPPPTANLAPTYSTQPITSPVSPTSGAAMPFGNTSNTPANNPNPFQSSTLNPSTAASRHNSAPLASHNLYSPTDDYGYARRPSDLDSHPSGYQQNPRAVEMTAAQRAALEMDEAQNHPVNGVLSTLRRGSEIVGGMGSNNSGGSGGMGMGGGYDGAGAGGVGGEATWEALGKGQEVVGQAWKGARTFFGTVAEKAMEVEGEVWKRVGGKE